MVVDTSALVAIMGNEPERHRFNRMIEAAAATYVSAASLIETRIVLFARSGYSAVLALDAFLLKCASRPKTLAPRLPPPRARPHHLRTRPNKAGPRRLGWRLALRTGGARRCRDRGTVGTDAKRAAPQGGPGRSAGVIPHTGTYFTQLTITSSTSSFVGMGILRCPTRGAANDAMPGPSNVLVNSGNMPAACRPCQPLATGAQDNPTLM